jgi:hypothetical protein
MTALATFLLIGVDVLLLEVLWRADLKKRMGR